MGTIRLLTGILAGAALMSCGGGNGNNPDVPTPGNLTLAATGTVPAGAGAILLTVSGGSTGIDTLVPASGYSDYSKRLTSGSFRTVLVGEVVAGNLATIHVPDTRKVSSYTATVGQAANSTTFAAMTASSFTVTVSAP
ncbi:MAG: hypothetical protein ABJC74_17575 [Gemmatimonadota bacterium]